MIGHLVRFALLSLMLAVHSPEVRPNPAGPGLTLVEEAAVDAQTLASAPRVREPREAIWRTDADGRPILSRAGFVRLKERGTGFYFADSLASRATDPRTARRAGLVDWADVDAMRQLAAVIRRFHALYPEGPRIGVDDLSWPDGGFGDFDGDGEADHLSHQTGSTPDLLLSCRAVPEVEVQFPDVRTEAYDREKTARLASLVFEEGALWLTTSIATGIFDRPDLLAVKVKKETDADPAEEHWQIEGGRFATLLKNPRAHGNHMNVAFRPRP